jgi:hypothetical protein
VDITVLGLTFLFAKNNHFCRSFVFSLTRIFISFSPEWIGSLEDIGRFYLENIGFALIPGLMQDERGLSKTLQPQYVCNLAAVARPAAALSGAQP